MSCADGDPPRAITNPHRLGICAPVAPCSCCREEPTQHHQLSIAHTSALTGECLRKAQQVTCLPCDGRNATSPNGLMPCASFCDAFYDACSSQRFAVEDERRPGVGALRACSREDESGACAPLDELLADGPSLCARLGLHAAHDASDCFDGKARRALTACAVAGTIDERAKIINHAARNNVGAVGLAARLFPHLKGPAAPPSETLERVVVIYLMFCTLVLVGMLFVPWSMFRRDGGDRGARMAHRRRGATYAKKDT